MDGQFDPARLSEWLRTIATTEDEEVDCDDLIQAAERLLTAGARGEDLRVVLPAFAVHLQHCPDCRDFYDTMVALSQADATT